MLLFKTLLPALAVLLVSFASSVHAGPTADTKCTQDGLEKCGSELIIFASGPKIATTAAELKSACPKEQASEKCARDYTNRCLPRLPKGMVTLFLDGVKTEVSGKCKEGQSKHKEYLKHAKCLNENGVQLHGCMSSLVAVLDQTIAKAAAQTAAGGKADQKKQLKESCCSFASMHACMIDSVKTPCGADTAKFVDNLIQGYSGDLLDTVCAAFPTANCTKTSPPIKPGKNAPKNLLSPLARMVSSLQAQG
ncbi:uncharacterized protein LOC111269714 [Varroa jacobsoni]|uniref:Secreted protein n=1 Tax=Varroa destructor TaxID=109461 RepID=A0A7M7L4L8_VARDE|nr:uncharacterized protein LOC111254016 [Varroa destructor]XP_022705256.1 uncharacterized protein LOC111269714 [Varroa jacobsoni]